MLKQNPFFDPNQVNFKEADIKTFYKDFDLNDKEAWEFYNCKNSDFEFESVISFDLFSQICREHQWLIFKIGEKSFTLSHDYLPWLKRQPEKELPDESSLNRKNANPHVTWVKKFLKIKLTEFFDGTTTEKNDRANKQIAFLERHYSEDWTAPAQNFLLKILTEKKLEERYSIQRHSVLTIIDLSEINSIKFKCTMTIKLRDFLKNEILIPGQIITIGSCTEKKVSMLGKKKVSNKLEKIGYSNFRLKFFLQGVLPGNFSKINKKITRQNKNMELGQDLIRKNELISVEPIYVVLVVTDEFFGLNKIDSPSFTLEQQRSIVKKLFSDSKMVFDKSTTRIEGLDFPVSRFKYQNSGRDVEIVFCFVDKSPCNVSVLNKTRLLLISKNLTVENINFTNFKTLATKNFLNFTFEPTCAIAIDLEKNESKFFFIDNSLGEANKKLPVGYLNYITMDENHPQITPRIHSCRDNISQLDKTKISLREGIEQCQKLIDENKNPKYTKNLEKLKECFENVFSLLSKLEQDVTYDNASLRKILTDIKNSLPSLTSDVVKDLIQNLQDAIVTLNNKTNDDEEFHVQIKEEVFILKKAQNELPVRLFEKFPEKISDHDEDKLMEIFNEFVKDDKSFLETKFPEKFSFTSVLRFCHEIINEAK